jgi:hypothetical protein
VSEVCNLRAIIGKERDGRVARGSWCGMNRIEGVLSFFSTADVSASALAV